MSAITREEMKAIYFQLDTISSLSSARDSQKKVNKWLKGMENYEPAINVINGNCLCLLKEMVASQKKAWNQQDDIFLFTKATEYSEAKKNWKNIKNNDPSIKPIWKAYRKAKKVWSAEGSEATPKPQKPVIEAKEKLCQVQKEIKEFIEKKRA